MAKSLQQVLEQIAALERRAEALREKEKVGVIARIRDAIAHYGITSDDLFGRSTSARETAKSATKATSRTAKAAKKSAHKVALPAKYADGTGLTWSGHGKRPNWFKAALTVGKTAEDLLIKN
ncbi:MAG TPA: H-NS histone family protein [Burkholderiaceae bacterium]|jgi:DNA-binding protein H-NS